MSTNNTSFSPHEHRLPYYCNYSTEEISHLKDQIENPDFKGLHLIRRVHDATADKWKTREKVTWYGNLTFAERKQIQKQCKPGYKGLKITERRYGEPNVWYTNQKGVLSLSPKNEKHLEKHEQLLILIQKRCQSPISELVMDGLALWNGNSRLLEEGIGKNQLYKTGLYILETIANDQKNMNYLFFIDHLSTLGPIPFPAILEALNIASESVIARNANDLLANCCQQLINLEVSACLKKMKLTAASDKKVFEACCQLYESVLLNINDENTEELKEQLYSFLNCFTKQMHKSEAPAIEKLFERTINCKIFSLNNSKHRRLGLAICSRLPADYEMTALSYIKMYLQSEAITQNEIEACINLIDRFDDLPIFPSIAKKPEKQQLLIEIFKIISIISPFPDTANSCRKQYKALFFEQLQGNAHSIDITDIETVLAETTDKEKKFSIFELLIARSLSQKQFFTAAAYLKRFLALRSDPTPIGRNDGFLFASKRIGNTFYEALSKKNLNRETAASLFQIVADESLFQRMAVNSTWTLHLLFLLSPYEDSTVLFERFENIYKREDNTETVNKALCALIQASPINFELLFKLYERIKNLSFHQSARDYALTLIYKKIAFQLNKKGPRNRNYTAFCKQLLTIRIENNNLICTAETKKEDLELLKQSSRKQDDTLLALSCKLTNLIIPKISDLKSIASIIDHYVKNDKMCTQFSSQLVELSKTLRKKGYVHDLSQWIPPLIENKYETVNTETIKIIKSCLQRYQEAPNNLPKNDRTIITNALAKLIQQSSLSNLSSISKILNHPVFHELPKHRSTLNQILSSAIRTLDSKTYDLQALNTLIHLWNRHINFNSHSRSKDRPQLIGILVRYFSLHQQTETLEKGLKNLRIESSNLNDLIWPILGSIDTNEYEEVFNTIHSFLSKKIGNKFDYNFLDGLIESFNWLPKEKLDSNSKKLGPMLHSYLTREDQKKDDQWKLFKKSISILFDHNADFYKLFSPWIIPCYQAISEKNPPDLEELAKTAMVLAFPNCISTIENYKKHLQSIVLPLYKRVCSEDKDQSYFEENNCLDPIATHLQIEDLQSTIRDRLNLNNENKKLICIKILNYYINDDNPIVRLYGSQLLIKLSLEGKIADSDFLQEMYDDVFKKRELDSPSSLDLIKDAYNELQALNEKNEPIPDLLLHYIGIILDLDIDYCTECEAIEPLNFIADKFSKLPLQGENTERFLPQWIRSILNSGWQMNDVFQNINICELAHKVFLSLNALIPFEERGGQYHSYILMKLKEKIDNSKNKGTTIKSYVLLNRLIAYFLPKKSEMEKEPMNFLFERNVIESLSELHHKLPQEVNLESKDSCTPVALNRLVPIQFKPEPN